MNPYQSLLDDPLEVERREHWAELRMEMAVPYTTSTPCLWNAQFVDGPKIRDRLAGSFGVRCQSIGAPCGSPARIPTNTLT